MITVSICIYNLNLHLKKYSKKASGAGLSVTTSAKIPTINLGQELTCFTFPGRTLLLCLNFAGKTWYRTAIHGKLTKSDFFTVFYC